MPNVRPSNVAPTVAIPPGLVDLATRLAADLPARIGAEVNPSRRIVRSFLHHVNAAAKAEKRRVANKGRGWERAEMRAMADKAGHDKAASDLLPLVQQVIAANAEREPEPAPTVANVYNAFGMEIERRDGGDEDGEVG